MSDAGDIKNENNVSKISPPDSTVGDPQTESKQGKATSKVTQHETLLDVPLQNAFGRISGTFSDISTHSADNEIDQRTGRFTVPSAGLRYSSLSPAPARTWKGKVDEFWIRNKGLALVVLAQFFGVLMNATTRLLETDKSQGPGMDPLQILFARMLGTVILSSLYQWIAKVEHAPFGPRQVWGLLVARGVGGFFGAFGLYYSLEYLALSDATVITFLAPTVACWACSVLIHEPFTRSEQVAGIVSFLGVILIARPTSLLGRSSSHSNVAGSGSTDSMPKTNSTASAMNAADGADEVTSAQRLTAVGVALIGVVGAACAYTTIRWIGKRAHPLISVNYYAAWTTIVSMVALLAIPGIGFSLPANKTQWLYLVFLAIAGFVMQFMLTAGLSYERSSRATNMVYTQMLFALAFDKIIFNESPRLLSIAGSTLILGSALYVAVLNNKAKDEKKSSDTEQPGTRVGGGGGGDEEMRLMSGEEGDGDGEANGDEPEHERYDYQESQLRTLRV